MSEKTEVTTAAASTFHPARRAQILNILARHMAVLITYESKDEPSSNERAIRKKKTKVAKTKILEVSRLMYDWSDLDEGPRRLLLETVEKALETVEKEVERVVG